MTDMLDRHRRIVRRIYEECLNRGELATVGEIVSDAYVGALGERGPDGFAQTLRALRIAFPDIHYTLAPLLADGDQVVVRWAWEGTHLGAFRTFAATGRRVRNTGISIYRLAEGRVVEAWLKSDRLGMLQGIGALPATPGGAPAPARPEGT